MAGLRKFPKMTASYTHADNNEAKHKEEETSRNARPSSAPSSPQAGRHLLANRQQQNKPYYKVTYPLRQRRKVNLENQCNAAPNAEYTVTGRGYTFTRHDNKLTMNIDTEVFFDDKVITASSDSKKKLSPTPVSQKQTLKVSLQRQLEESLKLQEKLHKALAEASVKLEEQKLEQENQKIKMLEQHENTVQELMKLHEAEKKKLTKAQEEVLFNLETLHVSKLADHQTATLNREILLKEEIQHLDDVIKQNKQRHEIELVNCLKEKEEELNAIHYKALSDLRTEMTNEYKKQLSSRIKSLEKQHEHASAEKAVKHKNEIEDLISRFKDSAQIEEDFKKASKLLKDCETEVEHLTEEKKDLTIQLRNCKAQLQETMSELYQYKQKFHNKVDEVKEQCDNTINQLTIENIDLRKRLLKKTEELSDIRMEEDKRLRNVQFNLKKSVIQARIKANLPVALGLHEQPQDEPKERQGSAPITKQEKDGHRKRLTSMEQEELSDSTSIFSPENSKHSSKRQSTA